MARPFAGQKFIAHCYDEADVAGVAKASEDKAMDGGKPFLLDELDTGQDALVLVGPEGDFSIDEVRLAQAHGFRSVSLGRSACVRRRRVGGRPFDAHPPRCV